LVWGCGFGNVGWGLPGCVFGVEDPSGAEIGWLWAGGRVYSGCTRVNKIDVMKSVRAYSKIYITGVERVNFHLKTFPG